MTPFLWGHVLSAPLVVFNLNSNVEGHKVVRFFWDHDVPVRVIDCDSMSGRDQDSMYAALNIATSSPEFPYIFVGGTYVGRWEEVAALFRRGELGPMLRDAGIDTDLDPECDAAARRRSLLEEARRERELDRARWETPRFASGPGAGRGGEMGGATGSPSAPSAPRSRLDDALEGRDAARTPLGSTPPTPSRGPSGDWALFLLDNEGPPSDSEDAEAFERDTDTDSDPESAAGRRRREDALVAFLEGDGGGGRQGRGTEGRAGAARGPGGPRGARSAPPPPPREEVEAARRTLQEALREPEALARVSAALAEAVRPGQDPWKALARMSVERSSTLLRAASRGISPETDRSLDVLDRDKAAAAAAGGAARAAMWRTTRITKTSPAADPGRAEAPGSPPGARSPPLNGES